MSTVAERNIEVYVFKTNLPHQVALNTIASRFHQESLIVDWSVDLEDIDCVLRVVSKPGLSELAICDLVQATGYHCEPLSDEVPALS